jgi:hypothetical protein
MRARSLVTLGISLATTVVLCRDLSAQSKSSNPWSLTGGNHARQEDRDRHDDRNRYDDKHPNDKKDDKCRNDERDERGHRRYWWDGSHRRWVDMWRFGRRHDSRRGKDKDCESDNDGGGNTGGGGTGGGTGGGGTPDPGTGAITGSVIGDNGAIASWEVTLLDPNGRATTTRTDASGAYAFTGLMGGDYLVCEADPSPSSEQLPAEGSSSLSAPCPAPYAGFGFALTLLPAGTAAGNRFFNGDGAVGF